MERIVVTDLLRAIDPTAFGWTFFSLFWALFVLYIRLWRSSGVKNLRNLRKEIEMANKILSAERELNYELSGKHREAKRKHEELHNEFVELRCQFSQLQVAYGKLGELVSQYRDDLNREKSLRDEQYLELVRAKAKTGDL